MGGQPGQQQGKKGVKRKVEAKDFEVKYNAILEVEKGQKAKSVIAKDFNIPASTLSTWLKNANAIKGLSEIWSETQKRTHQLI